MKVKEMMIKEVTTLGRNEELSLADDIMNLGRIRHLPVVEGDNVVGILSQRDLFKASLASAMGYGKKANKEFLKTVVIKEIMVNDVITVSPEADIKKAGRMMLEKKIGCLPVVENGKLVGIVTETDILRQCIQ